MPERGCFITLEGGEGAGKTTQQARLADHLRARGWPVVTSREPGGTPGAEAIRALLVSGSTDRWDPMTEMLLHFAARSDHVRRMIQPALGRGETVICDRFTDSTMAYQGYGHQLGPGPIQQLHTLATDGVQPDLTLILDLPVEVGLARATARDPSSRNGRYEAFDRAFHDRVRDGFHAIARQHPERCIMVDASPDMDTVASRLASIIDERFPP